jgi:hypothetical protein
LKLNDSFLNPRPWTDHYWKETGAFKEKHPDIVQPICEEDWMWFRGDIVEILTGDDKGKQGYIIQVIQERNWVSFAPFYLDSFCPFQADFYCLLLCYFEGLFEKSVSNFRLGI